MAILSRSTDYESLPQSVNIDHDTSENRNVDRDCRLCVSSCFKIVIIYLTIVVISLIATNSDQIFYAEPSVPLHLNCEDPFVSSLINLNSHSSTIKTNDDTTSDIYPALYQSNISNTIIIRLPIQWIDLEQEFLFTQQVTSGLGIKELFIDPGTLLTQLIIQFKRPYNDTILYIITNNLQHRKDNDYNYLSTSFTSTIINTFTIIHTTTSYIYITVTHTDLKVLGNLASDIPTLFLNAFGLVYTYDINHSYIDKSKSYSKVNTIAIETIQSYTLTNIPSSTSSTNILTTPTYAALPEYKYITISIRHTILALPKDRPNFNLNSYRRRRYHPKSGLNSISYEDEYSNVFQPRDQHYIVRHHLYTDYSSTTTATTTTTTTTTSATNSDTTTSNTANRATTSDNTTSNNMNDKVKRRRLVYYIDPHTPPEYHQCMIDGVLLWYVRDASILIT